MLSGILAGVVAYGFAKIFGEPWLEQAILFGNAICLAAGKELEPEIFSRSVQAGIGLLTGVVVYGAALGGLFALAFAFAYGRLGRLGPRGIAALLAGAGFVVMALVPALKYPANPPSIGEAETIGARTALFFGMILISIIAMIIAIMVARSLAARLQIWNAVLAGVACFIALVGFAAFLLPSAEAIPDHFPAMVLWNFRLASLGTQASLWAAIGLMFGLLAQMRSGGR